MQSTALSRSFMLTLVLAAALPQFVFAGQKELVSQHRFMRAELIGALYLPGDKRAAVATLTPPALNVSEVTVISASHACDNVAARDCEPSATTP